MADYTRRTKFLYWTGIVGEINRLMNDLKFNIMAKKGRGLKKPKKNLKEKRQEKIQQKVEEKMSKKRKARV